MNPGTKRIPKRIKRIFYIFIQGLCGSLMLKQTLLNYGCRHEETATRNHHPQKMYSMYQWFYSSPYCQQYIKILASISRYRRIRMPVIRYLVVVLQARIRLKIFGRHAPGKNQTETLPFSSTRIRRANRLDENSMH